MRGFVQFLLLKEECLFEILQFKFPRSVIISIYVICAIIIGGGNEADIHTSISPLLLLRVTLCGWGSSPIIYIENDDDLFVGIIMIYKLKSVFFVSQYTYTYV